MAPGLETGPHRKSQPNLARPQPRNPLAPPPVRNFIRHPLRHPSVLPGSPPGIQQQPTAQANRRSPLTPHPEHSILLIPTVHSHFSLLALTPHPPSSRRPENKTVRSDLRQLLIDGLDPRRTCLESPSQSRRLNALKSSPPHHPAPPQISPAPTPQTPRPETAAPSATAPPARRSHSSAPPSASKSDPKPPA